MSINPSDLTAAPWHWGKECKYLHTALKNKKKKKKKIKKGRDVEGSRENPGCQGGGREPTQMFGTEEAKLDFCIAVA